MHKQQAEDGAVLSVETRPKRKRGLLLVNLGTPRAPTRKEVARFLRPFLSDPRVIDLPRWLWLPLLYAVIIPLRAGRSAAAYARIWHDDGSPLLINTLALAQALSDRPPPGIDLVEAGMRYGEPSIASTLAKLRERGAEDLTVLPLYPQYSGPTTASTYDAVDRALAVLAWSPQIARVRDYHVHPAWVAAIADSIRRFREANGAPDRLLFSLHGIPQRYVRKGDPYEAQCRASVEAITRSADLEAREVLLTYQSRVGREPWLLPYTDETLERLAREGVRHVQVVCPGFAVDCLETLEEIAMQNHQRFIAAGGERLDYIPALNASAAHVAALSQVVAGHRETVMAY